jgi:protein ATS1
MSSQPQVLLDFPPQGTLIVDIAASMSHTVAVLSNGDVYGWGAGRKGQLGQTASDHWSPRKIDDVPFHACRVACGREFTYIVGHASEGKHLVLGSDKWSIISDAPAAVHLWKDIGASWGSIFVLLESGAMLSWGRNDHKQLCPPGIPKIQRIAVGSEHAVALTEHGDVIAWGWGEHGNCGSIHDLNNVDFASNKIELSQGVRALGAGCATSWVATSND